MRDVLRTIGGIVMLFVNAGIFVLILLLPVVLLRGILGGL